MLKVQGRPVNMFKATANRRGNNGQTSREAPKCRSDPSLTEACGTLAKAGDVLGVLALLRSQPATMLPPSAMDLLAMAIRQKESDLPGLMDAAFAEIVGFATLLLIRCQLHVERRLAESDEYGGDPTHVPADLDSGGWLERVERIARFLLEVFSARVRVEHVNRLNNGAKQKSQHARRFNGASPLDADPLQAVSGEGRPLNGRLRCPQTRIKFP